MLMRITTWASVKTVALKETANYYGALYADENNTLSFSGSSNFDRNTVDYRGALHADEDNTLSFSGTVASKEALLEAH